MQDYRYVQIEELEKKIEEARTLLTDPAMAELAQEEITSLEGQKQLLLDSIKQSQENNQSDDLDLSLIHI